MNADELEIKSVFVKAQRNLYHALLSIERLATVNAVLFRKFLLSSEVAFASIWSMPRAGRNGLGMVVEMPDVMAPSPAIPVYSALFTFTLYECRFLNFTPSTGTTIAIEDACQFVVQAFTDYELSGWPQAMVPTDDVITSQGKFYTKDGIEILQYAVKFRTKLVWERLARPGYVSISVADGLATLTCAGADAIYYTLDEGYPGVGNPAALVYQAPVPVVSGQTLCAAAVKAGANLGQPRSQLIP